MLASYNLSQRLKESLSTIESLRREILATPLPPKKQLQLRFGTMVDRIYYSLFLSGNPLKKSETVKILTTNRKNLKKNEQEVINYKNALDYIKENWSVVKNPVTPKTILTLCQIVSFGKLKIPTSQLKHLLDYSENARENPIIQAGLINIELMKMRPFTHGNRRLARLLSNLILSKYGYDCQGLLVFEKYWAENPELFEQNYQIAAHATSVTLWLEYFAKSAMLHLTDVLKDIREGGKESLLPDSFWELTDRQKSILATLEEAGARITNRNVQKAFGVSQITSSRDLAKLKTLGLLHSYGKGRSIYYTKT